VLSWVVTFRPTPRRSRKSCSIPLFRAARFISYLFSYSPFPRSPILRSFFQVPYPTSPLFATLTKTLGVWGHSSHFGPARSVLRFLSRDRPASSPLNATLMRAILQVLILNGLQKNLRARKSFSCNTYKKPGEGVWRPYLFTSLLHCFVFVPSVPLRRRHFGATIRKGTRFLYDPGKQVRSSRCLRIRERTSGTVQPTLPIASRAWVQRSNVEPAAGWLTFQRWVGKAGSVRLG